MMLVSFMILVFFVFFVLIQDKMYVVTMNQDRQSLKEINNIFISEVEIARSVHADYYHNFTLPQILDSKFEIVLYDSFEVNSKYDGMEYVNFLSTNVTGEFNNIATGDYQNTIYKVDGVIHYPNGTSTSILDFNGLYLNVNPETCYIYNTTPSLGCDELSESFRNRCNHFFGIC
ncbi:MAG: hypothetical protein ACQESE_04110 [Nanobdellota archaeon]